MASKCESGGREGGHRSDHGPVVSGERTYFFLTGYVYWTGLGISGDLGVFHLHRLTQDRKRSDPTPFFLEPGIRSKTDDFWLFR